MEHIEIKGRKYPVKFDMAAMLEIEDALNLSFTEALTAMSAGSLSTAKLFKLLFLGVKSGAERSRIKLNLTYNEFIDAVNLDRDLLEKMLDIVGKDMTTLGELMAERAKLNGVSDEDEEKKKVTQFGASTQE